jgi:maltose alpha-D-glucosyltransferase/alpha-amylase
LRRWGSALPTDRTLPLTATPFTLAIALGFVRNEGDAWSWILDHLSRALDTLAPATGADTSEADLLRDCEAIVGAIGKRLGELHAILSRETSNPAFAPKVADASDAANWARKTEERIQTAFEGISRLQTWQRDQDRDRAQTLLSQSEGIVAAIRNLAKSGAGTLMTRIHGDFHLGQVLETCDARPRQRNRRSQWLMHSWSFPANSIGSGTCARH